MPQVSDALLVMVQFKTALNSFAKRHTAWDRKSRSNYWVTEEVLQGNAEAYTDYEAEDDEEAE